MKKFLSAALAAIMMLSLLAAFAGCGKTADDTKSTDDAKSSESSDNTTDPTSKGKVKTAAEGKLTMATNAYFQPYEYYDGEDIVGIDAEIAKAIADKLGLELVINDMAFDSIISEVNAGKADIGLAGMTVTEDRLKEVDFTVSYANGVQSVIVTEDSDIMSVDDLDGKKIGTQQGTTGDSYCTDDYGDNVTSYVTGNEAVSALLGGSIDAVVIDNEPAKAYVANNKGLKILDTEYANEDYAACVAKGNTELLDALNSAITELIADGTIDNIVSKYIK